MHPTQAHPSPWPLPVKRKAMFEEPNIALCADDDCGLKIESIELLLCDAPRCNYS